MAPLKAWLPGLVVAGSVVLALGALEGAVRALGGAPSSPHLRLLSVSPGPTLFEQDPILGHRLVPGRHLVTLPSGVTFSLTATQDSERFTPPADSNQVPEVWVLGCSFAMGLGVEDDETFSAHLQRHLPHWKVRNLAVGSYGTLQAMLRLHQALRSGGSPSLVIMAHAGFHLFRNTATRARRRLIQRHQHHTARPEHSPLFQPVAQWSPGAVHVSLRPLPYAPWPFDQRSALVHALEKGFREVELLLWAPERLAEAIMDVMATSSRRAGAQFLVANVGARGDGEEMSRRRGWDYVDISLNTRLPKYRVAPQDGHPNALAHREYALRLEKKLRAMGISPSAPRVAGAPAPW